MFLEDGVKRLQLPEEEKCVFDVLITNVKTLIVGFCILLRVYPLMFFLKSPYVTMFLCSILLCTNLQHVSTPIGGHLQVEHTQNIYKRDHCICQRIR
jgi:hypothetical protein